VFIYVNFKMIGRTFSLSHKSRAILADHRISLYNFNDESFLYRNSDSLPAGLFQVEIGSVNV